MVYALPTSTKARTEARPGLLSVPAGTVTLLSMIAAMPAVVMAAGLFVLSTVTVVAVLLRIGASVTL